MITIRKSHDGFITLSRVNIAGQEITYSCPIGYTKCLLYELNIGECVLRSDGGHSAQIEYGGSVLPVNWAWTTSAFMKADTAANILRKMKSSLKEAIDSLNSWEITV